MPPLDPYQQCPFRLLNLSASATKADVLKQWRLLMRESHPDKNSSDAALERSKLLNDAKDRAVQMCEERERGGCYTSSSWVNDLFGDLWKRHREEERQWKRDETERQWKRDEAERQRKREEDLRKQREAALKKLKEEEAENKRREQAPIFHFIEECMSRHADAKFKDYHYIYTQIQSMEQTGKAFASISTYAAVFDMAKTVLEQKNELNAARQAADAAKTEAASTIEELRRKLAEAEQQLENTLRQERWQEAETMRDEPPPEMENQPKTKKQRSMMAAMANSRKINDFFAKK